MNLFIRNNIEGSVKILCCKMTLNHTKRFNHFIHAECSNAVEILDLLSPVHTDDYSRRKTTQCGQGFNLGAKPIFLLSFLPFLKDNRNFLLSWLSFPLSPSFLSTCDPKSDRGLSGRCKFPSLYTWLQTVLEFWA